MKNIVPLLAFLSSINAALTRTPCLTEEDCKARYASMNNAGIINGYFYSGTDLPMKGCILKGENFYFGIGITSEEMSQDDLSGEQQRVWCYVDPLTESKRINPPKGKASKEVLSMSMSLPLLTELEMSMQVQGKASKEALSMSMSLPSLTELEMSMPMPVQGKALKEAAMSMSVPSLTELEMSMPMPVQGKALKEAAMSMSLPSLTELEMSKPMPVQGKALKERLMRTLLR